MTTLSDYQRIERAVAFIAAHANDQPQLDAIASHVHLSPFHFQRLFTRWVGTTPKRFLQVLTVEHGKRLLREPRSVLDVTHELGLSSSARLHDHFISLEAATPGEYRARGNGLEVVYGFHPTPFGEVFVAATPRGVCRAAFVEPGERDDALTLLESDWPLATRSEDPQRTATFVQTIFAPAPVLRHDHPVPLHVRGTNFQIAVWRALLEIPPGRAVTYSTLARARGVANASRAVGNAVGANPIAVLIPCHRVIRQSGALGGYRWGSERKRCLQAWEKARGDAPGQALDSA